MWEFKRIEPKSKGSLNDYLKKSKVGFSFFSSPYSLDIFLNCGIKKLYLAISGSDVRLILLREKTFGNDVRILFSVSNDDALITAIKDRFDPVYIAYNMVSADNLLYSSCSERSELIVDTATIAQLADPKIKRAFNVFNRRHPDIRFEKIDPNHKKALLEFCGRWDQRPVAKLRIKGMENDKFFLDNYLEDSGIDGEVAINGDKIIGYIVFAPGYLTYSAVGLIGKCLRGYKELGMRLHIAGGRRALAKGFTRMAIGEIDPSEKGSFKSRLAMNGESIKLYSYEIFRSSKIKLHGDYLGSIV
jgi:hypothetical protein